MKLIIAGSRHYTAEVARSHVSFACDVILACSGFPRVTEVVSGGARGIDLAGECWARSRGITCSVMAADWNGLGRAAGPIRNRAMSEYADALLAVWDGSSRGTLDMCRQMTGLDKPSYLYVPEVRR